MKATARAGSFPSTSERAHPDTAPDGQLSKISGRRVYAAAAGFDALLPPEGGVPGAVSSCAHSEHEPTFLSELSSGALQNRGMKHLLAARGRFLTTVAKAS